MKFNNIHTALTDADLITTLETANVFRFGISSEMAGRRGDPQHLPGPCYVTPPDATGRDALD
jgi:hypothetical protein